ncbi:MAG: hypothetical protein WEB03_06470 [Nitriliruptor sp.]|uniref:hypothetical protein n=1 Tax=Nitriliruptor sp. TaxID=2448056 RepID=UPI00349FF7CD
MSRRQAYRAWEDHLGEVIGVSEAELVVADLEERITRTDLQAALGHQTHRLTSLWRRDLLLVITGQFVALAGVLTAIT